MSSNDQVVMQEVRMRKLFLILYVLLANTVFAGTLNGQKIIKDYCRHLPKDFMLEGRIFHDKDSRYILKSFLECQQSAESSDTIYIITQTTPSSASERVYLIRGDSVLYMKKEEPCEGVYTIRASQCKATDYFTEEYLSMLRTMSVSQLPFQYTAHNYDVARLVYINGHLTSYDSDHHFVSGCLSTPVDQTLWKVIPFPKGKTRWYGRLHPNRAEYNEPLIPEYF